MTISIPSVFPLSYWDNDKPPHTRVYIEIKRKKKIKTISKVKLFIMQPIWYIVVNHNYILLAPMSNE